MSVLNPIGTLQSALASIGVATLVFFAGYAVRWAGEDARVAERTRVEAELTRANYVQRDTAAATAAAATKTEKEKVRVEFRYLKGKTEWLRETRVEYLAVCLPDDGVGVWNAANAGEGGHLGVQPPGVDGPLPGEAPPAP